MSPETILILLICANSVVIINGRSPVYKRMDGAYYPTSLIGPATHGLDPAYVTEATLHLNGESYNLKESVGPLTKKSLEKGDFLSGGSDDLFDPSEETTPAPIQGAIDYVLLPLVILAVSGPIFVIIYIVMASVEFKLAPNVQLREKRSLNNRKHTYFDLYSIYNSGVKPLYHFLQDTVSRTLEHESCQEKAVCHVGRFSQPLRNTSPQFFDYSQNFLQFLVPTKFSKMFEIYSESSKNQMDCESFLCSYND